MAIDKGKSKMGDFVGVHLDSLKQTNTQPPATPEPKQPAKEKEEQPAEEKPAGGRPKFELLEGVEEKKVNFFCPWNLYKEIKKQANEQDKSVKQFICEVLLDEMIKKYGFKPE